MQLRTLSTLIFAGALALPLAAGAAEGDPRFLDRDLLTETLTQDEQEPLAAAEAELATAEAERDAAATAVETAMADVTAKEMALMEAEDALALDPTNPDLQADVDTAMANLVTAENTLAMKQTELTAKEMIVGEKQAVVQAILDEIALTGDLVGQLSDKQVMALNSALHSAFKTGLLPFDIDSDWLQRILDEDLGTGPIHQLVHAYAQEARFERLAARFDAKSLEAGDDKFAVQAERAREKGAAEYDKFVGKVDAASARAEAKAAAQEERRAAIRGKALGHSK